MRVGQQLEVPDGLGGLMVGTRYYYCGRSASFGVLLVWFFRDSKRTNAWRVGYIYLSQVLFEKELTKSSPGIRSCKRQYSMPPALVDLEGINCDELLSLSFIRKKSHHDDVQKRLESIYPLLEYEQEILQAHNPLRELSRICKQLKLASHVHRLQYWFFCYVLHGRNRWSLKPATHGNGTWSREDDKHSDMKFGRPYADKKRRGWPSSIFREQVIQSYLKRCGTGRTMLSICTAALTEDFGCSTTFDVQGRARLTHPTNKPFPTYGQFRHIVVSKFGLKAVQTTVYGQARMRNDALIDVGSYSSQYANALECLEMDAYRCEDRPAGINSDGVMPPLIVVRVICGVTGKRLGVGFSIIGERQEAYKSAIASMAMPAEVLANVYGVPIEALRGHTPVMARSLLSDRGPAGQQSLLDDLVTKFPVKSITASYSGQSKPTVESANPRSTLIEGAPSYIQSSHVVAAMMKREVLRSMAENHHSNIIDRLSPSVLHEFHNLSYPATPHFYWAYLSERLRTSAQFMDWREAIRAFGNRTRFAVEKSGLVWKGVTFSSQLLRDGLHEDLVRRGVEYINGYTLSLVIRCVWVEINGELLELEPSLRIQFDRDELLLPLSSLVNIEQERSEVDSATREAALASRVFLERTVKEQTGFSLNSGQRRSGSPKKSATAMAEAKALRGISTENSKRRA